MKPEQDRTIKVWQRADAVCFDFDSTVIKEEAIDCLAEYLGVGDYVAKLTRQAMSGSMTFKEALTVRLNAMNPSQSKIKEFVKSHQFSFTPGLRSLISTLQARRVPIYIVSGGFHSMIDPAAEILGIPIDHVFANRLLFYYDGSYAAFDERELTCESGGKTRVVEMLKSSRDFRNLVFIGDGMTDLETFPTSDAFIGFGGNVVRDRVRQEAGLFITDFARLEQYLLQEDAASTSSSNGPVEADSGCQTNGNV